MENDAGIARRQIEIVNAYGLHMRPSSRFVKLDSRFQVRRSGSLVERRERWQRQETLLDQ